MSEKEYLKHKVNVAVQVLPMAPALDSYIVVDQAIKIIKDSGVLYRVTPFETVMEGNYDELMDVVKRVQEVCYVAGASQVLCYVKIQSKADCHVAISDKMEKYD